MSDEYRFSGGGSDFPRVVTGEYPAIIDEVILSFSERPETMGQKWVSASFNLGTVKTTRDTEEEVRLRASGKESKFAGSAQFPNPSKLYQIIRAVGVDVASAGPADLVGRACIVVVQRAQGADGEYNSITGFLPIGKTAPPVGVDLVGVTNKRERAPYSPDAGDLEPAGVPLAAGDPNW